MFHARNLVLCLPFFFATVSFSGASYAETSYSKTHTIQKEETIYQISKKYGIPIEFLLDANGITDPTSVVIGRKILLSERKEDKKTESGVHVVKKGETLYGIAQRYMVPLRKVRELNPMRNADFLTVGMKIFIPDSSANNGSKKETTVKIQRSADQEKSNVGKKNFDKPVLQSKTSPRSRNEKSNLKTNIIVNNSVFNAAHPVGTVSARWPVKGRAYHLEGNLQGMLIESKEDSKVKSIAEGVVLYAAEHSAFQNVVVMQDSSGTVFVYGGQKDLYVKQGDVIKVGTVIGRVGLMPFVKKPLLYFAIMQKDKYINPTSYMG